RQSLHLLVPAVQQFEETEGRLDARLHVRRRLRVVVRHAFAKQGDRGIELALLALLDDYAEELGDVLDRLEGLAPGAHHMDHANEVAALQLLEAHAHVGARHAQRIGDLVGRKGLFREEEQHVDLGHRAAYAPAGAHFSPVEDDLLDGGGQSYFRHFSYF